MRKRGLFICHGRSDPSPYIKYPWIPASDDTIDWVYFSQDLESNPDVKGSYYDLRDLVNLGLESYDIIVDLGCPVVPRDDFINIQAYLKAGRLLLRKGGQFICRRFINRILVVLINQGKISNMLDGLEKYQNRQLPEIDCLINNLALETGFSLAYKRQSSLGDILFIV